MTASARPPPELAGLVAVAARLLRAVERVEGLDARAEVLEGVRMLLEQCRELAHRPDPGGGLEYLATMRVLRDVVAMHRGMSDGVEQELRHRSRTPRGVRG